MPAPAAIWPWLAGAGVGVVAGLCLLLWYWPVAETTPESLPAVADVDFPVAPVLMPETPREEGPAVQVKLAPPRYAARAKPPVVAPPAPEPAQAVAKDSPTMLPDDLPRSQGDRLAMAAWGPLRKNI